MARSMFQIGFAGDQFYAGKAVGPIHWNLTREEMEQGGVKKLRQTPIPKGWTGSYPYIVKVNTSGEYIVNADGSAIYLDYKTGSMSDPFQI
jgi:hypothetical protein